MTQQLCHLLIKMHYRVKVTQLVSHCSYRVILTQFLRVWKHVDSKTESSVIRQQPPSQCDSIT